MGALETPTGSVTDCIYMSKQTKNTQPPAFKVANKQANLALSQEASQFMNPLDSNVVRMPTLSPFRGAARKFTRVYTITKPVGFGDGPCPFGLIIRPTVESYIWYATGEGLAGSRIMTAGEDNYLFIPEIGHSSGQTLLEYKPSNAIARALIPITLDPHGTVVIPYLTGAAAANLVITTASSEAGLHKTRVETSVDGGITWVQQWLASENQSTQRTIVLAPLTSYLVRYTVLSGRAGMRSTVSAANVTMNLVADPSRYMSLVDSHWLESARVSRIRVSSMSAKCSYTGNLLEGAGVIGTALMSGPLDVENAENVYQAISRLPNNSYHGSILDGTYCYWYPTDLEEMDFLEDFEDPGLTSIWIGGVMNGPEGDVAMELTITSIVDFYSPLQIFEREAFPIVDEEFRRLLLLLAEVNPASCNPKHLDKVKKSIAKLFSKVEAARGFIDSHPEIKSAMVSAITSLAAL